MQGNHWCARDYGTNAINQNAYHYSNRRSPFLIIYIPPTSRISYRHQRTEAIITATLMEVDTITMKATATNQPAGVSHQLLPLRSRCPATTALRGTENLREDDIQASVMSRMVIRPMVATIMHYPESQVARIPQPPEGKTTPKAVAPCNPESDPVTAVSPSSSIRLLHLNHRRSIFNSLGISLFQHPFSCLCDLSRTGRILPRAWIFKR
jgi:hypothetical protein